MATSALSGSADIGPRVRCASSEASRSRSRDRLKDLTGRMGPPSFVPWADGLPQTTTPLSPLRRVRIDCRHGAAAGYRSVVDKRIGAEEDSGDRPWLSIGPSRSN